MTYVAFFNILFSIFVQTGINMVSSGFSDTRFIRYSMLFCIASIGYAFAAYTFGVYQEKIVQTIAQDNKKRMIDQLFCIPYSTYEKYEKEICRHGSSTIAIRSPICSFTPFFLLSRCFFLSLSGSPMFCFIIGRWACSPCSGSRCFTNGIRNAPDLFRKAS